MCSSSRPMTRWRSSKWRLLTAGSNTVDRSCAAGEIATKCSFATLTSSLAVRDPIGVLPEPPGETRGIGSAPDERASHAKLRTTQGCPLSTSCSGLPSDYDRFGSSRPAVELGVMPPEPRCKASAFQARPSNAREHAVTRRSIRVRTRVRVLASNAGRHSAEPCAHCRRAALGSASKLNRVPTRRRRSPRSISSKRTQRLPLPIGW